MVVGVHRVFSLLFSPFLVRSEELLMSKNFNKYLFRWRSKLSESGYDVEGCPNANPYAHTSCGILINNGDSMSLEYAGLFELLDEPFRFCVKAKNQVLQVVLKHWLNGGTTSFPEIQCSNIDFLFSEGQTWGEYILVGILGITLIVLSMFLIVLPPQPPKPISEEEMSMLIESTLP
eukprot:TRINITY_DN8804_c0_g1_i3.p1 TRINITY_DN8804_c0_g1~~TRINITY_DN8804_c0_g1_i3.p1  ORF type:complete len:176 (-),score=28.96 TRINITY_DN8804_c0_g1_i3:101-628(-)